MLFYISLANGQFLEIETDPKQTGKVILDKTLERLGVLETDLFGLQYHGPKGEELWLNLRNRIGDQLSESRQNKLHLRVKFFVMPQDVPIESTRELFYVQVKDAIYKGLISLSEPHCDEGMLVRIIANIAQIEHGDQTCNMYQRKIYEEILRDACPSCEITRTIIDRIHMEHSQLRNKTKHNLRYAVLKDASMLPGYGVEHHKATNAQGREINFGVGPEGIAVKDIKAKTEKIIPYIQIKLVTHAEKVVQIKLINDAMEICSEETFKLVSKKAAIALYRCITEMHSFYRCDTVCSDVQSQYCRDLKGTLISLFNENTPFGKKFIFDIQRTRQEVCDSVRRKLYANNISPFASPMHCLHNNSCLSSEDEDNDCFDSGDENTEDADLHQSQKLRAKYNQLKRRLESVIESHLCCICMDRQVSIVLCPCGHMICESCSKQVEQCPQCRKYIESCQKVYHDFGSAATKMSKEEKETI